MNQQKLFQKQLNNEIDSVGADESAKALSKQLITK
jgi:hypothetical protein